MYDLIKSALRNPISVIVAIIGVLFFAVLTVIKIPVDIFPQLNLPTIYVAQPYGGMAPDQMDGFIASRYQDQFLYVSGIKDIEVKSIQGLSLIKLSFYEGTEMGQAAAEVANQITRAQAYMPQGTVPPQVVRFDASSIPVGQLVFESSTRSLSEIQDFAASRIRPMFSKIEGVSAPPPFGGNIRTIVVKVNPELMRSYHLSPDEVVTAISLNNQPSPAGNVRIKDKLYMTPINSLVDKPEEFLDIPIKMGTGPTVFIRDIATVEDASDVTVSYALINGKRAVYIPVVKKADASTLTVVDNIKKALPQLQNAVPMDVTLSYEFDQSVYVVNAVKSLISEGVLGALLTGLMVLLFLKDWRSVIVVVTTIPISILSAVILLNLFGQTINIMTLSGFALAVGVLVDEATVTIENIHQHQEMGKRKASAIWDACKEVAFPKLLILLCILAVFAPAFIMQGIPRAMFLPLSLAVGFAMVSSFLLSQTFVPVLSNWLLKDHSQHGHPLDEDKLPSRRKESFSRKFWQKVCLLAPFLKRYRNEEHLVKANEIDEKQPEITGFEKFRHHYIEWVGRLMDNRRKLVVVYLVATFSIVIICFHLIGTDILPKTNSGQFQLRLRTPDGTRIERTEKATREVLDIVKSEVGAEHIEITSSYVGTTPSSYGSASIFIFTSGPHEAVLQVAIKEDHHVKMDALKEALRAKITKNLPDVHVSFEPIELVEKVMSQGSPTPIEVAVAAKNIKEAHVFALHIMKNMGKIDFLRDVQIAQPLEYPIVNIQLDRKRAGQLGVSPKEIAKSMVAATSSSRFTEKNMWLDNKKGVSYQVQVQLPENKMTSLEDIAIIPLKEGQSHPLLADVATLMEQKVPGEYDRSGPNRLVTITANMMGTDLGRANAAVEKAIAEAGEPPRGILVSLKGQVKLLTETLNSLQLGLMVAIVVIFLLLSANFQSFKVSLVILSTIPAVLSGALVMLLLCGATLNLQSYMGLIMSVGVSVANAILMITNAETLRLEFKDAQYAAITAASSRLRPILMTSIAMVAGMIPMASGLGEGGDQIAPLGQAVIGGLVASTLAALLVLPNVFALVQGKSSLESVSLDPEDPKSKFYISPSSIPDSSIHSPNSQ